MLSGRFFLEPINDAAKKAANMAEEAQSQDPNCQIIFEEVKKVRDLCAAASSKTLTDPFTSKGVTTNLVHIITLE